MTSIHYGCQSYPWKMSQGKYAGALAHMVRTAKRAGFAGLEIELDMLGDWLDDAAGARRIFDENDLTLTALVFHQSCRAPQQSAEEQALLTRVLDFLALFPGARLMVSHQAKPGDRPDDASALRRNRENLMACLGQIADRAGERGIVTAFHPNSSVNSLFRTAEDYELMFHMLAGTDMGYAADIGHIVNGGMDPVQTLMLGRSKLRHVHFKDRDASGRWAVMGAGSIDYPAVIRYLNETGYAGWIMVEDESERALLDPDGVVIDDGAYITRVK